MAKGGALSVDPHTHTLIDTPGGCCIALGGNRPSGPTPRVGSNRVREQHFTPSESAPNTLEHGLLQYAYKHTLRPLAALFEQVGRPKILMVVRAARRAAPMRYGDAKASFFVFRRPLHFAGPCSPEST